ncbi:putative ribonuclease H-like domain-containing protein [Tanacetum coccineum]|uniref:Ribonuclease H-like domain-containing protein n=1 Tax=Tanacetum coccineum TaxID=301880 RepID=A0ABQ5CD45_9ASTR
MPLKGNVSIDVVGLIGVNGEDEVQANMALMAFTDSEVSTDKTCSKTCLHNYETLKKQYDDLRVKLDDTAFKAATYKRESNNSKENTDDLLTQKSKSVTETSSVVPTLKYDFPNAYKHMVPRAVLMRTGLKTVKNAKPLSTDRPMFNTVRARVFNDFKPSAVLGVETNQTHGASLTFNKYNYFDAQQNPSQHMSETLLTSQFKEFDGGIDTFGEEQMEEDINGKGIKREYSVARTPQQNGVAERKNRTLIEAARTMLADSKLPTTFWAEAVSTACYVQNRVLVVKPHNKTPYELFRGIKPAIGFMKPFGCHVTILNTLDKLGKFDGKSDEGMQEGSESNISSQKDQDCIFMPIWKDASYFEDITPHSVDDVQLQGQDGNHDDSSFQDDGIPVSTADVHISTAGGTATYSRRSTEKRKDKGKGIMTDEEPKKKSKKELEQERLSFAEAIRLEEQMHEEQRAQIARDAEIARQWDEEERKRAMDEAEATKKIDWNDPSVLRYHSLKMKPKSIAQARRNMIKYLKNQGNFKMTDFKGMSYNEVRPIFEKLWDFNQKFVPMDAEKASKKQKSPEKESSLEKIVEEKVVTQEEKEEPVKEPGTKRKKSIPRKSTRKRQKIEEDSEKEELKELLDIIPREEVPIEVESISTKFPIVDWKSYVLTETFMYYQIFRGDGSSKSYKIFTEMLRDFDRHDVEELYRLVKERYKASRPEGYDLMLWGDLHTIFEPNADDELWKNLHQYNLISWSLYDFCGIHMLLMDNGLAIHMLTEKKYPLSQEMLSKMLSRRLEVDHESSQAFELLRFIRAQVQK